MIKGRLVGLRAIEREDLRVLRDWRNIQHFRENFREVRELSMSNQEQWHNRVVSSANDFMFIIERLSDGEPLGACGLLYINWVLRSADCSIYIGHQEAYIDTDYAFDASQLLFSYGFKDLNLHKIWMELYEFDSKKIDFFVKQFRFHKDGVLRDNCFKDGTYYNSFVFSLLDREFNR